MEYQTLIIDSLREVIMMVVSFVPTLVIAIALLIVGCLVASIIRKFMGEFFSLIKLDMIFDRLGITAALKNGGMTQKPSKIISNLIYVVFMFIVLMITVKAFGLEMALVMFDEMIVFIPTVITGIIVLIVGMLMAQFVSKLVYIAAKNTDMPSPHIVSRLAKLSILIYVGIMYLREIGFIGLFVGINYTILIGGIVLSLALAFGLAGKGIATRYLDCLGMKKE
jgi:hypothetical protein